MVTRGAAHPTSIQNFGARELSAHEHPGHILVPWRTLLFVDHVFNIIVLPSQFNFHPSIRERLIKTPQLRQPRPKQEQ